MRVCFRPRFGVIARVAALALALGALALLPAVAPPPAPVHAAASFTVNVGTDGADPAPGDGICEDAFLSGNCTLHAAIEEVNAGTGTSIDFDPAVTGVLIGQPLPDIALPITIDGSTACVTSPCIFVDGFLCGACNDGIVLRGGNSTLRGLIVSRFRAGSGILIAALGNNLIAGNYVGTSSTGTAARGNLTGITVSSSNNKIGTIAIADRNVISGNRGDGIVVDSGATGNTIIGDYIGTRRTGDIALGNGGDGIHIQGASSTTIGDAAIVGGTSGIDVISANGLNGVEIDGNNNTVTGDLVGLGLPQNLLGNGGHGVLITNGTGNIVGSVPSLTAPPTAGLLYTVVSGNGGDGVRLQGAGTTGNAVRVDIIGSTNTGASTPAPNAGDGVNIQAGAHDNTVGVGGFNQTFIQNNTGNGVHIDGVTTTGNTVGGVVIGLAFNGSSDRGNALSGVLISNAPNNTIGGSTVEFRSVISGNNANGITLSGTSTTGTTIRGNYVGTDTSGTVAVGNTGDGISIDSASGTTIGTGAPSNANVISGNSGNGVSIFGNNTSILGDIIGLNAAFNADLGNAQHGVNITGGSGNIIGVISGSNSTISGNDMDGVHLIGAATTANTVSGATIGLSGNGANVIRNNGDGVSISAGAHDNTVSGVFIGGNGGSGIHINGPTSDGNKISQANIGGPAQGNSLYGILVQNAANTIIGSSAPGKRSKISSNSADGIFLSAAAGTKIVNSYIGVNYDGTVAEPNLGSGVNIANSTTTTVGGTVAAERNVISGHSIGVVITGSSTSNVVEGNYIGTDATGLVAIPNIYGVGIAANGNTIGGNAAGSGNLISGNQIGLLLTGGAAFNSVGLNLIGTTASGTAALGNGTGVQIDTGSHDNALRFSGNASNTIAYNVGDGVLVDGAGSIHNDLRSLSFHDNGGKGISLTNGANAPIVPPVIQNISGGFVSGTTCANCHVNVYSDAADEGALLQATTTADGAGAWSVVLIPSGPNVTAIATDTVFNTSEFSQYDTDGDGVPNGFPKQIDNCPNVANPSQTNTDAAPLVTPGAPNDTTIPNSDTLGDACDPDDDNDGILDGLESIPCGFFLLDPLKNDTDGDRVLDGAECALGSNPNDPSSKPAIPAPADDNDSDGLSNAFEASIGTNPNNADTDGDRVSDGIEYKGYNTSPLTVDSDGDGCSDGREVGSVDGNHAVNSTDLLLIGQQFGHTDRPVHDLNKNGTVNSSDLLLAAQNFGSSAC